LQDINNNLSGDYVLTSDIDASDTQNWNQLNWCGTYDTTKTYYENDYIEESGNYYYQLQDEYVAEDPFDSSQWVQTTEFTGGSEDDGEPLGFRPLGNNNEAYTDLGGFSGSFDGQNHTITGLYINRGQENNAGLFGYAHGSTIENIGLEDVDVSKGSGSGWYRATGGLVGYTRNSTVQNSYSTGDVSGSDRVGGLVGHNYDFSTVSNSYSTGDVSGDATVGGLVGYNQDSSTVQNSYSTGTVSGEGNSVGGLVGYNQHSSTVSNSYTTGDVSGSDRVGGLVGYTRVSSTVQNSYATGTVSGDNSVGGLVGRVWNNEGETDEILYSYANSDINPDLDLIGADDTSGTLDTTGSSLKTTAEMTDYPDYPNAYEQTEWNIDTDTNWTTAHWNADQRDVAGYPALTFQDAPRQINTPDMISRKPIRKKRIADERRRLPSMKYRLGKNRR